MTISRRTLLQSGTAAGAMVAVGPWVSAGAPPEIIRRKIPSTGEEVPVVGIGTGNFKDGATFSAALHRFADLNGSVVDTAALFDNAETMLGNAMSELGIRKKLFVETKFNAAGVGFASRIPQAAPPDEVSGLASFERSLKRLKTERVDLLMAHIIGSWEPLLEIMLEEKKKGRARYIGITTATPAQHGALVAFMQKHPIDFIQVDYSLDNRVAENDVFPVAIERKIAIMGAVPFGGRFNQLLRKAADKPLPAWTSEFDARSWAQVLLKYIVSHPAVTCVVPNVTEVWHVEDNLAAGRGRLLTPDLKKRLEDYWDELMGKTA